MSELAAYIMQNPEFSNIKMTNTSISYNGQTVDMSDFNVENFISKSSVFLSRINTLSAKDVFKIIKIHVEFERMQKNQEKENKKVVEDMVANDPRLSNIHFFTNKNIYGEEFGFLHYVDQKGENHVLSFVSSVDFMAACEFLQSNNMEITDEHIYNYLASNHEQVLLEDLSSAEKRVGVSEEHLNNLRAINEKNALQMENHSQVLGCEKYGIYINNKDIITMHYNKNGEKIIENHDTRNNKEGELKEDYIDNRVSEPLISFEEYKSIVLNPEGVNEKQKQQVRNFESFLGDVVVYKEYLTEDVAAVYEKYQNLYNYISTPGKDDGKTPSTLVVDGKDTAQRYQEIEELNKTRQATQKQKMGYTLARRLPPNGYMSAALFVAIVILAGIVIGIITIMAN